VHDAPFTSADAHARASALLRGTPEKVQRHGALLIAEGRAGARTLLVAANDPARQRGAIGSEEARALTQLFARACSERMPVVLVLDSSGARVDEDLPALGAFRELFREALRARLAGVPMLALLGTACFGGASLLACICERRSYLADTLLAASGPRVIASAERAERFDATDPQAVHTLLGAAARIAWHPDDQVRPDTLEAARHVVHQWLQQAGQPALDLPLQQANLELRLARAAGGAKADSGTAASTGLAPALLDALLPPGYEPVVSGRLVRAEAATGGSRPVFVGALGGGPLDAPDSAALAGMLLALRAGGDSRPVVLLLDASAHAASVRDERVLLSDYLVHLSLVIAALSEGGHRVALWIVGQASGASYVAFAAAADTVSAAVDARIEILPPAARASIVGARGHRAGGADSWLSAGVADALLEKRLRLNIVHSNGSSS